MTDQNPLRGDPDDEQHHRLVELIRQPGAARGEDGRIVLVLTPDEIAGERVNHRAGMVGTILAVALLYGAALGVVLGAHLL